MPLTSKGKKIKKAMTSRYGSKKGKEVFYASANKGTIKGVSKGKSYSKGGTATKTSKSKKPKTKSNGVREKLNCWLQNIKRKVAATGASIVLITVCLN